MNIVAFLNPKGGVGKSTLAVHVARALQSRSHRVLVIDTDTDGWSSRWGDLASAIYPPVVAIDRATLEREVAHIGVGFDWIIIDGGGRLERLTVSAVKAADLVIVPIQPSALDVEGARSLTEIIVKRQALSGGRPAAGFVVNAARARTRLAVEVRERAAALGLDLFAGAISDLVIYRRAMETGATAVDCDARARREIFALVDQIEEAFNDDDEGKQGAAGAPQARAPGLA